jgi:hypothetical protein
MQKFGYTEYKARFIPWNQGILPLEENKWKF